MVHVQIYAKEFSPVTINERKFLKGILTHSYFPKYIATKMVLILFMLRLQDHTKNFWIHYMLWLKMAENVFSVESYVFSPLLYYILLYCVINAQFMDNIYRLPPEEWHTFIFTACKCFFKLYCPSKA